MLMLTYGGEDCGGIVEGSSKLPRHPGFVRSVEQNNLLEEAKVVLEESCYRMILLNMSLYLGDIVLQKYLIFHY